MDLPGHPKLRKGLLELQKDRKNGKTKKKGSRRGRRGFAPIGKGTKIAVKAALGERREAARSALSAPGRKPSAKNSKKTSKTPWGPANIR